MSNNGIDFTASIDMTKDAERDKSGLDGSRWPHATRETFGFKSGKVQRTTPGLTTFEDVRYTCHKVTAFHGEVKRKERDPRWNVCRICWNTLRVASNAAAIICMYHDRRVHRSFVFARARPTCVTQD